MPEALTDEQNRVLGRVHNRLSAFPETHSQKFWYCGPRRTGGSRGLVRAAHGCSRPEDDISVDAAEMSARAITSCLSGHAVMAAMELGVEMPQARSQQQLGALLLGLPYRSRLFVGDTPSEEVRRCVEMAVEDGRWTESGLAVAA